MAAPPATPRPRWRRSWSGFRRGGSGRRPKSPRSSPFSLPTKRATSPAPTTPWTAAAPPPKPTVRSSEVFIMPVVLDPDAAAVFKIIQEAGRPPYETLTAAEARAFYLQGRVVTNPEPPELKSAEALEIPSPAGKIPARIYTPVKLRQANGLSPCLVFFHGGGWVIGDIETHDVVCRKLAHEGELIVISVDYRLAPEHKFPAAADDAIAATAWIAANAKQLGIDPSRLTVRGD